MEYNYLNPNTASNVNLVGLKVSNGTKPSNIKIVRPANEIGVLRAFISYCGVLPQENIVV